MSKQDGGPAFPVEKYDIEADMDMVNPGMSLRDWFAGQALSSATISFAVEPHDAEAYAKAAYLMADAMLAEREKDNG